MEKNEKIGTKSFKTPIELSDDKMLQSASRFGKFIMPKQVVVTLPSAADGEGVVFMVHPIEGVVDKLHTVAAGVRGRVFGLQCTREVPLDDMSALARFYVQHVRAKQPHPPYTLLGHSFGASVALEMALQLQKENCEARLVLVDGSPAYARHQIKLGTKKKSSNYTDFDESKVLGYFLQFFTCMDAIKVLKGLECLPDWNARVRRVITLLGNSGYEYSADEITTGANSFYRKLVVVNKYRPAGKLRAPVHLFTARDNFITLGEDYGLREVCVGALHTTQLPIDHRSILTGDCASEIIKSVNMMLEK